MKKKWIHCYLLLGNLIVLILCCSCSLLFVGHNLNQAAEKRDFESIYVNTSVDFIVPGPSVLQVKELEEDPGNGIAVVTPFYETTSPIEINGSSISSGTAIIFPLADKIEYTPYGSKRIIDGASSITGGNAIADQAYAKNTGCSVGDSVLLRIGEYSFSFVISSISETNTYYNKGTIALVLTEEDARILVNNGIQYSAAYISASDLSECEKYLFSEYKPLSRLKDVSEFDSEEVYNKHLANFNSADWSKEITNCQANYNTLSIKYDNVQSSIWLNIGIVSIITVIVMVVFNLFLLTNTNMKMFMRSLLVKKSGTVADIRKFYRSGIIVNCIVFCISMGLLYILLTSMKKYPLFDRQILNFIVPVIVAMLISTLMIWLSLSYVEKHYKIQHINKQEESKNVQVEVN